MPAFLGYLPHAIRDVVIIEPRPCSFDATFRWVYERISSHDRRWPHTGISRFPLIATLPLICHYQNFMLTCYQTGRKMPLIDDADELRFYFWCFRAPRESMYLLSIDEDGASYSLLHYFAATIANSKNNAIFRSKYLTILGHAFISGRISLGEAS